MIEVGKISLLVAVAGSLAGSVSTLSLWGATMVARLRRCQSFAWLSAMAAVMNLLLVVVKGRYEVSFSLPGSHHSIQLLLANPTTAFLLLLICGVGAVVESFSLRYLQGDADAPVFFARTGVVLCAMAVVVTASLLITVTLAWVVVGWMFPRVVRYRRDSQAMVKSSQALRRSFIIGDLALVFATAVILNRVGNVKLSSAVVLAHDSQLLGPWSTLVALLIVVAALVRSAQLIFSFWLPTTVAAPTPVSSLLHAGVVNGGGILLIRLGPLSTRSEAAMVLALVSGVTTALMAFAVMRTRADIKGTLVYSTMSQMGFMIAECAVGLPFAALMHLVGHGIYKATLFFRSGTAVPRLGERTVAAPRRGSQWRVAAVTVLVTAMLSSLVELVVTSLGQSEPEVLLAFVVASFGAATWYWFNQGPRSAVFTVIWIVFLGVVGTLYALALAGVRSWTEGSLVDGKVVLLSPWWLLVFAVFGLLLNFAYSHQRARQQLVPWVAAFGGWVVRDMPEARQGTIHYDIDETLNSGEAPAWVYSSSSFSSKIGDGDQRGVRL